MFHRLRLPSSPSQGIADTAADRRAGAGRDRQNINDKLRMENGGDVEAIPLVEERHVDPFHKRWRG